MTIDLLIPYILVVLFSFMGINYHDFNEINSHFIILYTNTLLQICHVTYFDQHIISWINLTIQWMRIHVERIMIKHTIYLYNSIVIYLNKIDHCIEICRIRATIMLSLLVSYMYICNGIHKILLIYSMHFRDIQRL